LVVLSKGSFWEKSNSAVVPYDFLMLSQGDNDEDEKFSIENNKFSERRKFENHCMSHFIEHQFMMMRR
jgi:hypothetical protein